MVYFWISQKILVIRLVSPPLPLMNKRELVCIDLKKFLELFLNDSKGTKGGVVKSLLSTPVAL